MNPYTYKIAWTYIFINIIYFIINTNTMKEGGEAAPEADNAAAENPPADEEQPLVKSEKAPTV